MLSLCIRLPRGLDQADPTQARAPWLIGRTPPFIGTVLGKREAYKSLCCTQVSFTAADTSLDGAFSVASVTGYRAVVGVLGLSFSSFIASARPARDAVCSAACVAPAAVAYRYIEILY